MLRSHISCALLLIVAFTPQRMAQASSFGFSVNINFGIDDPVREGAGIFGDVIWNPAADNAGDALPILADINNDIFQTGAAVSWTSRSVEFAKGVTGGDRGDQTIMRTFLSSPSEIRLEGLNNVLPGQRQLNYSLVVYSFGGQEGEDGVIVVNDQARRHVDTAEFNGDFIEGGRGNIIVFPNLSDPDLFIKTDGHVPINAMSLVYCLPGDFDGDGQVDVRDLEQLNEAVMNGESDRSFDVNLDLTVDFNDVMSWIKCSKGTCVGDVNLDGVFDSNDLVELFTEGLYDTENAATWTSGDWNGDFKFDSDDLVFAFIEGCYDTDAALAHSHTGELTVHTPSGSAELANSVPEPTAISIFTTALLCLMLSTRKQIRC